MRAASYLLQLALKYYGAAVLVARAILIILPTPLRRVEKKRKREKETERERERERERATPKESHPAKRREKRDIRAALDLHETANRNQGRSVAKLLRCLLKSSNIHPSLLPPASRLLLLGGFA